MSSRKQANVDKAVAELKAANISVWGQVCHVGKQEDRQRLIEEVSVVARMNLEELQDPKICRSLELKLGQSTKLSHIPYLIHLSGGLVGW